MKEKLYFKENVYYIELKDRVILYNVYDYYNRLIMDNEVMNLFKSMSDFVNIDEILIHISDSKNINFINLINELVELNFLTKNANEGKQIKYVKRDVFVHNVTIRITDACNLRCTHCFPDSAILKSNFSITNIYKIIDEISSLNVIHLTITGGEPFLVKDIIDIVKYANKKGIIVTICTNGILIKPEQAMELSSCAVNMMKISLDSMKKEHHEFYKGKDTFNKAIDAISLLRQYDIPVCINTCISKVNIEDAYNMIDFAISKNVNEIAFDFIRNVGRGRSVWENQSISKKEKQQFQEFCKTQSDKNIFIGSKLISQIIADVFTEEDFKLACNVCKGTLIIASNGDISPCYLLYDCGHVSGNLSNKPIKDIIISDRAFHLVNTTQKKDIEKCAACKQINECFQMCRGLVIKELDDFLIEPSDERCIC